MKIKIMNIRTFFAAASMAIMAAAIVLAGAANTNAQRRFDPKATGTENELRNVALATQDLLNFVKQAQYIEQDANAPAPEKRKLIDLGRRVKDGTSNLRGGLQGFSTKLKNANKWNADFDAEFLDSITSPRIKSFIQRLGGARAAITQAESALASLGQDVDGTLTDSRVAFNQGGQPFFMNASFAPAAAEKIRIKCVLLGVGVAGAEIVRLKLTAENLDNLFDSNKCGGGSSTVS